MTARDFAFGPLHCRWQACGPDRLAIARGWLGTVAGAPSAAALRRDARTRPRLPPGCGDVGWSHTRGQLLLAYAPHGQLGVDVEATTRPLRPLEVAHRYFAPEEAAGLATLEPSARPQAFVRLWCAKEAVLKAHGHGLAFGLHRLAFDPCATTPRLLRCDPALGRAADWTLHAFAPAPGFLAVLAWHPGILPA